MANITLPDGKIIKFDKPVTGSEVAEKISKSLAKQALIMSVNGELKDLYSNIDITMMYSNSTIIDSTISILQSNIGTVYSSITIIYSSITIR